MPTRRLLLAALLLLGIGVANLEESFIHTDDGCAVETHCNACLLRLATPGVVASVFALHPVIAPFETVGPSAPDVHEDVATRGVPSRGPPAA